MNTKNNGTKRKKATGNTKSSIKPQQLFTTNFSSHNPQASLMKAQAAFKAAQWQQTCIYAQECINLALFDAETRNSAKNLLAASLANLNQTEQALVIFVELHNSNPNNPLYISNIGLALMHLKQYDNAIKCFQRAIELAPDNIEFQMHLGLAFYQNHDFAHAKSIYQKVAEILPHNVQAKFGVAWSLQAEGLNSEAITAYEEALKLEPNHLVTLSNLIFIQYTQYPFDIKHHVDLLQRYNATIDQQFKPSQTPKLPPKAHSPLRVGFASADLRNHVVSYFLESTLHQLKNDATLQKQLTLVAYANQLEEDSVTLRLKNLFNQWRRVDTLTDEQLAEQIQKDEIDILIDLSGHTHGNRLSTFIKKPAPLQVSWLGYWGSTGLSSMDYILADPICAPESEDSLYLEKIWRLPDLRYCFSIPNNAPEITPPPCISKPHITFSCYKATTKINQSVLQNWARILQSCPLARIRLQSFEFATDGFKEQFIERMQRAGIDIQRVDLVNGMVTQEYLASYAEIDILLDTFPYTGGTTTAEALWMGVPTITLATAGMLGRQGEALMVNAGLSDWVAYSEEEYVQKAIEWAQADDIQRQALAQLRATMRENIKESPVFNAKKFATEFTNALIGMWQDKYV